MPSSKLRGELVGGIRSDRGGETKSVTSLHGRYLKTILGTTMKDVCLVVKTLDIPWGLLPGK